jgi:hypothetical protein
MSVVVVVVVVVVVNLKLNQSTNFAIIPTMELKVPLASPCSVVVYIRNQYQYHSADDWRRTVGDGVVCSAQEL